MIKKITLLCCGAGSLFLLVVFAFSSISKEADKNNEPIVQVTQSENTIIQEVPIAQVTQSENAIIQEVPVVQEQSESETLTHTIYTHANFNKEYTYDELIADSEIVAYGKVSDVTSYVEKGGFFDGNIFSRFNFEIESVLKGNMDSSSISVLSQGGTVTFSEFFLGNEDDLSKKLAPEEFEIQKSALSENGSMKIEEIFAGAENIKDNDDLLLFLSYDYNENIYYIVGTSAFGKLNYDQEDDTVYANKIDDQNSRGIKSRGRQTNLTHLTDRVSKIKDNSETLKEKRLQFDSNSDSIMTISK